ncbi:MAG: GHMP kinase [Gammaproteobacteria bacterium]|nr:GHMP kinase [Gammaproteobacteria bacterium]
MSSADSIHVCVEAPARLHLGFLDMHGGLGRLYGSIGLTIDSLATRLRARRASDFVARGPGADRALEYARAFAEARELPGGVDIRIEQAIPDHVGLGSGTQLSLAVGTALERLYGSESSSRAIAHLLHRGARSGIGIGAFEAGGFIIDAGRGDVGEVPPVAVRFAFPTQWRVLLLLDSRGKGLHGNQELAAFAQLTKFSEASAGYLCRLVMMKVLPGLVERRLELVAEAIGEIQRVMGDHFAPVQGGRFTSPAVSQALAWITSQGYSGVGQSSWGPTGFVLLPDESSAIALERGLKQRFGELSPLKYLRVAARNRGATLETIPAPVSLINKRQKK